MKSALSCLLCAALVLCMIGCAPAEATASVPGYSGDIRLRAVRDGDGFALSVEQHSETPVVGAPVVDTLVAAINEKQSLAVDVVAGATVTSLAVLQCAETALARAGVDPDTVRGHREPLPDYAEYQCDVVVVGAGGAGLVAAIEAAKAGASVIVVEKNGVPGGSTLRSYGRILAVQSDLQLRHRVDDTPEALAGLLYQYADKDLGSGRALALATRSADNIRFLERLGVPVEDALYTMPGSVIERLLQIGTPGGDTGLALVVPLVEQAEKLGVVFLYNTRIYELTTNAMGEIKGVLGRASGNKKVRVVTPAVVLATGGFSRSPDLVQTLTGLSAGVAVSSAASTGDGVEMARAAGARVFRASALMAELVDQNYGIFELSGLTVDNTGARFCNEAEDRCAAARALMALGKTEAWLILDSATAQGVRQRGADLSALPAADTLDALGEQLELPQLADTAARYNAFCSEGKDPDFDRPAELLSPLGGGPYYAVRLTLRTYGTTGGIYVDSTCRALTAKEDVVPGLYGAGELVNGNYFARGFPGFGASLAQVVETGRVAGAAAAAFALGLSAEPEPGVDVTAVDEQENTVPVD